jgi:hypothetical protein
MGHMRMSGRDDGGEEDIRSFRLSKVCTAVTKLWDRAPIVPLVGFPSRIS